MSSDKIAYLYSILLGWAMLWLYTLYRHCQAESWAFFGWLPIFPWYVRIGLYTPIHLYISVNLYTTVHPYI